MRHVDVSGKTQLDDSLHPQGVRLDWRRGHERRSHHVVFQHEAGLVFVLALDQLWFQAVGLICCGGSREQVCVRQSDEFLLFMG